MDRKQISRAKRNSYLFAHMDADTANFFIELWDSKGIGEVCEDIDTSLRKFDDKPIFTNNARNKLTEYGNKVALDKLLSIPEVERTCKFAKFDMEELQKNLSHGFATEWQKEMFLSRRNFWFSHLKERMRDLRISKETLESFGLSWKAVKSFAYQTI